MKNNTLETIQILPCSFEDIAALFAEYAGELASPFDSFLEEHITASVFYRITDSDKELGYCAVHNRELLSQFFVAVPYRKYAQELFRTALDHLEIKRLYVSTGDELLLSLALDLELPIHLQAYFFQDTGYRLSEEQRFPGGLMEKAELRHTELIREVSGDFLDRLEERIAEGQIYVFHTLEAGGPMNPDALLGIGVMEISRLLPGYASIGMFTNESYRRQGVGKSIIAGLKDLCYQMQLSPLCGCWYYNHHSQKTLESAGMASKTRLLRLER